jgi:hypothetical protein
MPALMSCVKQMPQLLLGTSSKISPFQGQPGMFCAWKPWTACKVAKYDNRHTPDFERGFLQIQFAETCISGGGEQNSQKRI